jgi:predicted regulator of Ras-like GTPase activity (Roadblock/LC7/MglB family)
MELPATAGAIVALPDGLQVASEVPEGVDADMLAAFVPQIFDRAGQGVAELRMGELTSLTFTAGNVPWVIFRGSSVYFAVFGRKAGPLPPDDELSALAAELDRKQLK